MPARGTLAVGTLVSVVLMLGYARLALAALALAGVYRVWRLRQRGMVRPGEGNLPSGFRVDEKVA